MEIKAVRIVDGEEKSAVQVEKELIEQHEKQLEEKQEPITEEIKKEEPVAPTELREEDVLSFIKSKKNIEVNSLDEFEALLKKGNEVELPEDVKVYLDYKKENGRTFEDFVKLQKDYSKEDPEKLIREFYSELDSELSAKELEHKMKKFRYDEDLDDEDEIIEKQINLKQELAKAREHFEKGKERYKIPTESAETFIPETERENYKAYKEYLDSLPTAQQESEKKRQYFAEQTDKVLSDKFEGFKFKAGEKEVAYKPAEASALKEAQSDIMKFIGQFVDENGFLKDAEDYHRRIAVASDVDKFFSYAFELGKAEAVSTLEKDSKNIDMGIKPAVTVTKEGLKIRDASVNSESKYKLR
jgi:hypothetical protein